MISNKPISQTDKISLAIVILSILLIVLVLWKFAPNEKIYMVISLVGSVASTGGLIIAIIQIIELRKTAEATQTAITSTEKELSILRSIESATNCFNQMNQIDEYLETNNIDSIKTLLPIATKNFHEMVFFKGFELEELMQLKNGLSDFLENFASQLTIWTNHRNLKKTAFHFNDEDLNNTSKNIQKIKAFANKYKTQLQQEIVKD